MLASAFNQKIQCFIFVLKPVSTECVGRAGTEPRVLLFLHASFLFHLKNTKSANVLHFQNWPESWKPCRENKCLKNNGFNQFTPTWLHLCHVLSFSSSRLGTQGYRQTLQQADLTSLLNLFSPCFQILKKKQICVLLLSLTWMWLRRSDPVVMYRGKRWPREFQQWLFMFAECLPLFDPQNTQDILHLQH